MRLEEVQVLLHGPPEDKHRTTMYSLRKAETDEDTKEERQAFLLEAGATLKSVLFANERKILRAKIIGMDDVEAFKTLGLTSLIEHEADSEAAVKFFASNQYKVWSDHVEQLYKNKPLM